MKKASFLALALAVVMMVSLLAGCGQSASSSQPESQSEASSVVSEPVGSEPSGEDGTTVTDMMGRTVNIPADVQSVVVITASTCEIVYALGAGDMVVARGEYCDYPEAALAVDVVNSGDDTNVEQILALQPQVVFMASMAQDLEPVEQLEAAGIAVVITEAYSIEETYTSIRLIGSCLGKEAEAEALVLTMQDGFETIRASIPQDAEPQTVYFEVSPLEWGLWTAGSGTFMDEIAQICGLENIFADVTDWAEVSQEQVIERNPDIIITTMMYYGEGDTPTEEILGRDGWQDITAVKDGQVYSVGSNNEMARPGPRLLDAANSMAELIYGDQLATAA